MADMNSGSWRPEVGDRRQVTVEINSDGEVVIVEPRSSKPIDLQGEFDQPPGTKLKLEVEITETAGLTGVIAETVGDSPISINDPSTDAGRPTRQELLDDLRRLAADLGKTPTTNDVASHGAHDRTDYFEEFDSFITALKEAKLEPTELQYRFSSEKTPVEMQRTKNVDYLREHGPSAVSELPTGITHSDKRHGAAKFSIYNNVSSVDTVYYLMDEHEPKAVIRKFFEQNPKVVENNTQRTLSELAGNHGREFKKVAGQLAGEYKE